MTNENYKCVKCATTEAETGEIRTTGSGFSRIMNLQNQKFGYLACTNCGHTEFYKLDGRGKGMTILDILGN